MARNQYKKAAAEHTSRVKVVGIALFLVTGIGAGVFYSQPWQWSIADHLGHFPFKQIKVASTFHHLNSGEIRQIVTPFAQEGFFGTDVAEIQGALLNRPWIADVAVRRVWPDVLSITVVEESAVAHWGERSYINPRGQVFTPDSGGNLSGLPHFNGPHGAGFQVLTKYKEISGLLQPLGLGIRELSLDERRSWQLVLNNGIRLAVGKEQDQQRIKRFVGVYKTLLGSVKSREIAEVDLRYANGLVVRWRTTQTDDNNAQMS